MTDIVQSFRLCTHSTLLILYLPPLHPYTHPSVTRTLLPLCCCSPSHFPSTYNRNAVERIDALLRGLLSPEGPVGVSSHESHVQSLEAATGILVRGLSLFSNHLHLHRSEESTTSASATVNGGDLSTDSHVSDLVVVKIKGGLPHASPPLDH